MCYGRAFYMIFGVSVFLVRVHSALGDDGVN